MARDIEEFLRRAAERRKQQQQQKQGGQRKPPAAPPVQQTPPRKRRPAPKPQPARLLISEDEVQVIQPRNIGSESLEAHVRRHMDTRDVTEHASHLAEDLERADERMDERLQQKFDHEVGTLDNDVTTTASEVNHGPVSQVAKDMIELINNPKTMRQAIIISEILRRPELD